MSHQYDYSLLDIYLFLIRGKLTATDIGRMVQMNKSTSSDLPNFVKTRYFQKKLNCIVKKSNLHDNKNVKFFLVGLSIEASQLFSLNICSKYRGINLCYHFLIFQDQTRRMKKILQISQSFQSESFVAFLFSKFLK